MADLATTSESEDVGRKWMLQSEREFRSCIAMNTRDDYSYQSMARLFLEWAKRVKSPDEASEYVTKSEETISEGLRQVRERESLWIVSSEVQKWLANEPGRITKLRTAVAENISSVIPRYLLGRAYREQGDPEKCIEILDPVLKTNFREFRSFVLYVRAMLDLNQSYAKCIAVLSQCQTDGIADPSYVGLLGGLLCMDGKGDEAAKIFDESTRQGFSFDEKNRVQFRPRDSSNREVRLRLSGTVVAVKPAYVFVQNEKFSDFMSRTTRVESTILQRGMKVTFEPAFSARGAQGFNVQLAQAVPGT